MESTLTILERAVSTQRRLATRMETNEATVIDFMKQQVRRFASSASHSHTTPQDVRSGFSGG